MMRYFVTLLVVLGGFLILPAIAPADVILLFEEVGGNVELSASGSFDITGAVIFGGSVSTSGGVIIPNVARVTSGVPVSGDVDLFTATQGVTNFGTGGSTIIATSGTGDTVGGFDVFGGYKVVTPRNYVSGTLFSSSSTFSGQTFGSMGLTEGDYLLGTLPSGSTLTASISASAVPEPTSLMLVSIGIAGFGFSSRRRRSR